MARLFTIGFTGKSAEQFFRLLRENQVRKIIDVRLNTRSQLSGFAKGDDLRYFASLNGLNHEHRLELAPGKEMLTKYRSGIINWEEYANEYLELLKSRNVAELMRQEDVHACCFLCSEHSPEKCHRRLLAEYLSGAGMDIEIAHLM